MTTESLIDYIKKELNKNVSKELITSQLTGVGWHIDDIEEGFQKAIATDQSEPKTPPLVVNQVNNIYKTDPYHESIDSSFESQFIKPQDFKKVETEVITDKVDSTNIYKESSKEEVKISPKIEQEVKEEIPPKIWIPKAINSVNNSPSVFISKKLEPFKYELEDTEVLPILNPKKSVEPILEKTQDESFSKYREPIQPVQPIQEEVKPVVESKVEYYENKEPLKQEVPTMESMVENTNSIISNLPKKAMISSYSQDYMSANKLQQEVSQRKKSSFFKWLIVLLIFVVLISVIFAFSKGYIKIPDFGGSFIKKDPETIILNNAIKFSALTSYKVKTEATISLPLFANITSGLMSGSNVSSLEKEFFSYKIDGKVNKDNKTELFSDYDITLNSSMLKNEIKTNIKTNGLDSFISIPDLSMILDKNTPPQGVVLIPTKQIEIINIIIPEDVKEKMNNIDLTKLIPNSNSNYLNNQISFKDLVKDFEFIKIDNQKIHNINSEHYSINVDRESLKNILDGILEEVLATAPLDQKTKIKENLSAVSLKSLEFWIGKKDENIYKYKFSLTIPLSKIIGLEDKSIANSEVSFDLETTFYDLNVLNEKQIPSDFMTMSEFLQTIADIKIKNTVSSFIPLSNEIKNTLGNYGVKSNTTGSCINPESGSIFSPLGHAKGALTVVGKIADTMNSIVNKLSGDPQCFSTSKAWAISSPLVSDPNKYFCIDSVGNSIILNQPLSTTVCQ